MTAMRAQQDAALHADAERPSRREQILQAAAQLFAERGSRAVGVDDIGAAVGVSGPAIYRHFASKDAMLAEMLRADQRAAARPAAPSGWPPPGPTRAAQLRALIAFQVDFALDNPALITVQDRDLGSLPDAEAAAGAPAAAPLRRGVGGRARPAAPGGRRRRLPGPRARRLRADQLHPAQRRPARPRRRWPTLLADMAGPPRPPTEPERLSRRTAGTGERRAPSLGGGVELVGRAAGGAGSTHARLDDRHDVVPATALAYSEADPSRVGPPV